MNSKGRKKSKLYFLCSIFGLCAPGERQSILLEESRILQQDCKICLERLSRPLSRGLRVCSHSFHYQCLIEHIQFSINEMKFPIVCPMDNCGAELLEIEIKNVLNQYYRDRYKKFSLKHYIETHPTEVARCSSPNCDYYCLITPESKTFFCPTCKKSCCVKCKLEDHGEVPCDEFAKRYGDQLFSDYVKNAIVKKCPVCGYYVSKTEGCNHMTCRCKTKFCYGCEKIQSNCSCCK